MTDLIRRSDAHRIALHYSGDVAAQKIMELPAVNAIPISALEAFQGKAWIPATERLPKGDGIVLTYGFFESCAEESFELCSIDEEGRWWGPEGWFREGTVTHWQQLPEPPGGEDKMIRIKQEYGETEIRTVGEVKDVVMEAACIIRALRHSIYSEVGEDAGKELDGIIGRRDFFESWDPMREDLKRKETEL